MWTVHMIPKPPDGQAVVMPKEPELYYAIGEGGVYKRVRNRYYEALVKVNGLAHMAKLEESARLFVSKIPSELFNKIEAFFGEVYKLHKSEAAVVLFYDPDRKKWGAAVPAQVVSAASVKYEAGTTEPPAGFKPEHLFGSMHSHAAMSAFFSGTDNSDEANFDGPHVVMGNFDSFKRVYSSRWILAGQVFKGELCDIVEEVGSSEVDPSWVAKVMKQEPVATTPASNYDWNRSGSGWQEQYTPPLPSGETKTGSCVGSSVVGGSAPGSGIGGAVINSCTQKQLPFSGAADAKSGELVDLPINRNNRITAAEEGELLEELNGFRVTEWP